MRCKNSKAGDLPIPVGYNQGPTQGPDVVPDDLRLEYKHQKGQGQVPASHIGWSVDSTSYGWGPHQNGS